MIHLLTGENSFEIERRLQSIVASFAGDAERIDGPELTPEQLPDIVMGQTLFASERLIVIKNVSTNTSVWSVLDQWLEKSGDTDIVFIEAKPDKRTKTYKWLQKHAHVVETTLLSEHEAEKWVVAEASAQGATIDARTARFLVEYVGTDQWRLQTEIQKLVLSGRDIDESTIHEFVEPTPQATSFELLDAAFAGRHETVERVLKVVGRSEDPYMFFGLLSSQLYAIALMHTAGQRRPDEIAKAAGVHPFVLKKVAPLARQLTAAQLGQLTEALAELDTTLKSLSVDPWTQLKAFLVSLRT